MGYTLEFICRDIDLIEKSLETSCRTFLYHKLHEYGFPVHWLGHSLLFNNAYLFSEHGLEEFHDSLDLALDPVCPKVQETLHENPACFTPIISSGIHIAQVELLLIFFRLHI